MKAEIIGSKVNLIDTTSTGDSYLDGALSIISEFDTNKKVSFYLNKLWKRGKDLFPLFTEHLESQNLMNLSFKKNKLGPHFNFTVINFNDDVSEEIINMLKEVLLKNNNVPDKTFMYFLIILKETTNFYGDILGKEYKKQVKYRLKELIIEEPIGKVFHRIFSAPDPY